MGVRKSRGGSKTGVAVFGARYSRGDFSLGAIDYGTRHTFINIGYAETGYTMKPGKDLGLRFAAQYSDQRSTGSNLLTGRYFFTNQVGARTDVSYRSGIISLSFTTISRGYDLQNPWSGNPGYTSSMISDFNKAGTSAVTARLSYDFTRVGLEGVAAYVHFGHGWGMVDKKTKAPLPNENEFDADLQWRPAWRYLQGLWVHGRYGVLHQYEGTKEYTHDCRIIVNYDFQLL